jgi:amidase
MNLLEQNNCLHEIFFQEALSRAAELDRYLSEHGRPVGVLHGLPVSLKDQFHVKGVDTTMGYVGWIGTYEGNPDPKKVHNVESQVVNELCSEGAILYCKVLLKDFKRSSLYPAHVH